MCDSRRPEAGADSDWSPHPFRVLVEDSDGGRVPIKVNAIGRHDATNQAKQRALELGYDVVAVLRVEEAS